MKPRLAARGFTLLEMMVVLAIALILMVLIVPLFQVTTRTVQTVERKLAIYEAARNILDMIDYDVRMAVFNERGNTFSLKNANYTDTDTNLKISPPGTPNPATGSWDKLAYRQSRREADGITYAKKQGGGFRWANNTLMSGSQAFALSYPEAMLNTPEGWKTSIRSSLQYPYPSADLSDDRQGIYAPKRSEQLANINEIGCEMVNTAMTAEWVSTIEPSSMLDPVYGNLMPGYEHKKVAAKSSCDPGNEMYGTGGADFTVSILRTGGPIHLTDLDIAYWDEGARAFKDPPENTLLALAPGPRAIRITITVCDREARGSVTLCRIIQLPQCEGICDDQTSPAPAGGGSPQIDTTALDATRLDLDAEPFNRPKDLTTLEPAMFTP